LFRRRNLRTTVPRLLALLLLVAGVGVAQAVPLHYSFDLGSAGFGDFRIKADATAPLVDQLELTSFNWHVAGVGAFDLADLAGFNFGGWTPLVGATTNANGLLSLGFLLKTSTQSDTGVACTLCVVTAQLALPGTNHGGTLARSRIRAAGTPCGSGLCVAQAPTLAVVPEPLATNANAVPEPSALSLAALALLGAPLMKRRATRG
jgi:hypothetical protein